MVQKKQKLNSIKKSQSHKVHNPEDNKEAKHPEYASEMWTTW